MRAYGINYDTGLTVDGRSTRPIVRRATRFVATSGRSRRTFTRQRSACPARIPNACIATGRYALEAGLELWFSPMTYDMESEAFTDYMARCAAAAESASRPGRGRCRAWLRDVAVLAPGSCRATVLTGRMATMADPATWTNPETVEQMTAGLGTCPGGAALDHHIGPARPLAGA